MMIDERYKAARAVLDGVSQQHALKFYHTLDLEGRQQLLGQIETIDWRQLRRLIRTHVREVPKFELPGNVEPAPWYANKPEPADQPKYRQARQLGEQLVREGKVAAFTVAGGQGTRLGWDGPKGSFPATPIRKAPLFQCFAEYILKTQQKYDTLVPWYVMTSPANDAETWTCFDSHDFFGLDRGQVMLFPQAMMPAVDMQSGKVLLAGPDSLALSPNGHGGSLKALYASGAIADMQKRGIEQISYIQVDNPIVRVIDPQFIGLHAMDGAQMSSKMLPKAYPKERLGNFCIIDGKMTVIEYSDLPDELAEQRLPDGQLRFLAGSIAIHALRVDFVEWLNTRPDGFALPFHRAEKKVPYIDTDTGERHDPDRPNAVKLEMFVFDALPFCDKSIIYETDRADEFGPIKDTDSLDSPATSRATQIERAGHWLELHGVKVPRNKRGRVDAVIEISQLTAIESKDLDGVELPNEIERGSEVVL